MMQQKLQINLWKMGKRRFSRGTFRRKTGMKRTTKGRKKSFRRFSRGLKRGRRSAKNYARVVETAELLTQPIGTGTQRTLALGTNFFPRSAAVAVNYKWFRLSKVEWEYRPKYNTYQETPNTPGSAIAPSMPWLWTMRAREMPIGTFDPLVGTGPSQLTALRECSAVMRRFNRKITLRYKPNTLTTTTTQAQAPGVGGGGNQNTFSPAYNKWFPTQDPTNNTLDSDVDNIPYVTYYGHYDYVDQDTKSPVAPTTFDVFLRCTWEFKEPQLANLQVGPPPAPAPVGTLAE